MDDNLNIENGVEREVVRFSLPIRSVNLEGYGDVILNLPYTIRSVNGDGSYGEPTKYRNIKK